MIDTQISTEAPVVDTSAPVTDTAPKETFNETLDRVANEAFDGKRDTSGRFQPRVVAPGAPATTEVPGSPQTAPPDPATPVIEAPQSLPADVKSKWDSFPPEAKQWLADREKEIHQKFTADGERLKSLGAYDELAKSLDGRLKQLNAPGPEYFRRLAVADDLLSRDGIAGIRQIAQMYGIDLRAVLQQPNAQPQTVDIDAKVNEGIERRMREGRVAEKAGEIDKFRGALPSDEQADFDSLEAVMMGLVQANPNWSLEQLYKAARRANPDTLARDEAKAKAEADKKATEEAKARAQKDSRLTAVGRRPGSTPTAPVKGKSWQDTMDKVADEVFARS